MLQNDFIHSLRDAIATSGMDKSTIAQQAGISRKTLYDVIEGNNDPRWSTLEALAQVLGLVPRLMPLALGDAVPTELTRTQGSMVTRLLAKHSTPIQTHTVKAK